METKKLSMKQFQVAEIPPFRNAKDSFLLKPKGNLLLDDDNINRNSYNYNNSPTFGKKLLLSNEFSYQEEDEYDEDDDDDDNGELPKDIQEEPSLASTISSTSTASSQLSKDLNLQVEIGLENMQKNKEILHELSLTMKNMPTISLDSESMNRGSFIKSVTFAEENDILEFDYTNDMIFPDYETPVKERSKLLGSSLEDDEDNDKIKTIPFIITDPIDNNTEDGISGWNTSSKILDTNDDNNNSNSNNNSNDNYNNNNTVIYNEIIGNKTQTVQDSNDRIKAAMEELKSQLTRELCPVNEWLPGLLIPIAKNEKINNDDDIEIKKEDGKKVKKKKASFAHFDTTDNNHQNTNTIETTNTTITGSINDNTTITGSINDKKIKLNDTMSNIITIKENPINVTDNETNNATISEKEIEKPKKKKKGISFRMDDNISEMAVSTNNNVSPISVTCSNSVSPTENTSPVSKVSPSKPVTVIGSLRTEALAIPRDIIETHIERPSVCVGGSMSDLRFTEMQKLQMQSINGSTYSTLDSKTTKVRVVLSCNTSNDFKLLPRTVQYKRSDGVKAISIYHHDPADQEFYNRTLSMKIKSSSSVSSISSSSAITKHLAFEFMNNLLVKQGLGFICILIDKNLQVIGSYDDSVASEEQENGLEFGPSFFRVPTRKDKRKCQLRANLLEIDLKNLSDDVFAVVPIAYDECMKGLSDADIKNVESNQTLTWDFFSTKEDQYVADSVLSLSDEVATKSDGFHGIGGFKFTNQGNKKSKQVFEEISSYVCHRNWKEAKKKSIQNELFNQMINSKSNDNSDRVFSLNQGIIPSIFFRSGLEGGWAIKTIGSVVSVDELDMLYGQVVDTMIDQNIIPFHLAHVEHCHDCADHQMSTRHEPGSYESKFSEIRDEINALYPPTIFVANNPTVALKPRLGSFEFSFQCYADDTANLVFSKLKKGDFPTLDILSTELDTILDLDNSIRFGRGHAPKFKIALVDAYDKKPVYNAVLKLYRLSNKVTGNDCFKKNSAKKLLKKATIVSDADIRYTDAYAHVRSWGKDDIMKWFLSAGASEEAGRNAIFAGVIDGTSFLKLVDSNSLQKWGVINRRHLKKLEDFLISIKGGKSDHNGHNESQTQSISQDKQCQLVLQQSTDINGICSFNIDISGCYYIKVESSNYETFYTHSILVDSVQKFLYSALLQPKLLQFKVIIYIDLSDSDWLSIINAGRGLMLSLYNLESGKRHFVRIKIPMNLIENKIANELAELYQNFSTDTDTDTKENSNNVDNSISSHDNGKKKVYSQVTGRIFLPLGIYFNEVSGTILNLYKKDDDTDSDSDGTSYMKKNKEITFHFESRHSSRCHNRLLRKAVRKFQHLYRRYYLRQREWLYATIMRCQLKLMRYLKRARERITYRKTVIIQACFRRYREEMRYAVVINGVILIQSVHRGYLGRKRIMITLKAATIVSQWVQAWILYLRRKAIIRVKEEQRRVEEEIRRAEEERQEQERIRLLKVEKEKRDKEKREREELERLEKALEDKLLQEKERNEKDEKVKSKAPLLSKSMFKGGGGATKKGENLLAGAAKAPIVTDDSNSSSPVRNGSPMHVSPTLHSSLKPTAAETSSGSPSTGSPTLAAGSPDSQSASPSSSKPKSKKINNIRNKFKKPSSKGEIIPETSATTDDDKVDTNNKAFIEPNYLKDDFVVKTAPVMENVDHKTHETAQVESNSNDSDNIASNTNADEQDNTQKLVYADLDSPKNSSPLTDYQLSGYIYDRNADDNKLAIDTSTVDGEAAYLSRVIPSHFRRIASMSPMKIIQDSTKLAHHHISTTTSVIVNSIKTSKTLNKLLLKTSELRERVPRGVQELRKYLRGKKHAIRNNAATLIQAMVRGVQCRIKLYQDNRFQFFIDTFYSLDDDNNNDNDVNTNTGTMNTDENIPILPIDRPRFRPNISIIIDGKNEAAHDTSTNTNSGKLSNSGPKTPMAKIQDAVNTGVANFEVISKMIKKDLKIAKEITSIKGQALVNAISSKISSSSNKAINATQEYLINKQNALERKIRRENYQFSSADAILNVHGSFTEKIPLLNAHFYIGIYPQASDDVTAFGIDDSFERLDDETGVKVKIYPFRVRRDRAIERHSNKEGTQSTYLYPFSPQQFMMTSFNCHLVDVSRYTTAEICIFIEADVASKKFEGPYEHQGSSMIEGVPPVTMEEKATGLGLRRYVPAFYGDMNLGRGGIFGPQGGRMHVSLRADQDMIQELERNPKLSALKSLDVVVTMLPVSIPSSSFLYTFRKLGRVAPCYPSFLVDAELLEHKEVEIDRDNHGAVISINAINDRIFVSMRNRGLPYGVVEYNTAGSIEKKLCDADKVGIINQIICGHNHIACCGSNGSILFLYEGYVQSAIKSSLVDTHPGKLIVSFGCVIVHGGMDIFFTGDKSGNICVSFMDRGKCLRQYVNSNFLSSRITNMNVFGTRLYISQSEGVLTVINIQPIFQGMYEAAGQMKNMIVLEEQVYSKESGIVSTALVAPNAFLGVKDEDEINKIDGKYSKVKNVNIDNQYCADIVEGHILLLGGGDSSPHITILQPYSLQTGKSSMREVATLVNAHEKAVTQIVVDAAGRHIFSASSGAKQIKIWDGLSFTVESQIDDINVSCIALAPDCFLVGSVRAPFFRMWKCKNNLNPTNTTTILMARSPANSNHDANNNNNDRSDIGIVTYRNPRWCTSVLLGKPPPTKSLVKAITTDDDTPSVLNRWSLQYIRPDDETYNLNKKRPPLASNSGKATPRKVRNAETPRARQRRQYEKKLLSPDKENSLLPHPRRLQRVNESNKSSKISQPVEETKTAMATITSEVIIDNDKREKIHFKTKNKLHFSDSEDDDRTT